MQVPVISRTPKALWQTVLQDQCDELLAGYCTGFPLMAIGVAVAKGHVATVIGQGVGITNDTPFRNENSCVPMFSIIRRRDLKSQKEFWDKAAPRYAKSRIRDEKAYENKLAITRCESFRQAGAGVDADQYRVWGGSRVAAGT